MKIKYWVLGTVAVAALVGIGSSVLPAYAGCSSGYSSSWLTTKSCSAGGVSGQSTGMSGKVLKATLLSGAEAVASCVNSASQVTLTVLDRDDLADPFPDATGTCPATTVKHFVSVN
jgi:hypothetical protein